MHYFFLLKYRKTARKVIVRHRQNLIIFDAPPCFLSFPLPRNGPSNPAKGFRGRVVNFPIGGKRNLEPPDTLHVL